MFSSWKNREECERLRDSLEISAAMAALPARLQEHLSFCADCQAAADELLVSRALLRKMPPPLVKPGPWFAPRVMAAIVALPVAAFNTKTGQRKWHGIAL